MKRLFAIDFPLVAPLESDLIAIEDALQALLTPSGHQLGFKFASKLRKWLQVMELPKRCLLLLEGYTPQGVYFIISGSVLVGNSLDGGSQLRHILRTGDFILPLRLFSEERSLVSMRTAEKSRLIFLDTARYQLMLKKFPEAVTLTNLWREKREAATYDRATELKWMTATERMVWLHATWPDCFQVFSDEVIGAYLNLRRETVCRHKREVIKRRS